jgi:hypothetical protein
MPKIAIRFISNLELKKIISFINGLIILHNSGVLIAIG